MLPPPPTPEVVHEMMNFLVAQEVPDEYVPLMLEELELDGADARTRARRSTWSPPMRGPPSPW